MQALSVLDVSLDFKRSARQMAKGQVIAGLASRTMLVRAVVVLGKLIAGVDAERWWQSQVVSRSLLDQPFIHGSVGAPATPYYGSTQ